MMRLFNVAPWPQMRSAGIGWSGSRRARLMIIGAGVGYRVLKSAQADSDAHALYQSLKYGGLAIRLPGSGVVSFHIRSNRVLKPLTSSGSGVKSINSSL